MKFDIGDLVDYRPSPSTPIYQAVILNKVWREHFGGNWYYKLYFIDEDDEAWIEEERIRLYGGFNGV